MVNKRLIELAERQKNPSLPAERQKPESEQIPTPARNGDFQYNFLEGDFGRDVLGEYDKRVEDQYNGISALSGIFSLSEGVVKGSNPFAFVLLNRILKAKGVCIATLADLEKVIKANNSFLDLRGIYQDSDLILRSEGEPNEYLARNFASQLIVRKGKVEYPMMIPLVGLDLQKNSNSPHGLIFKLTDESEIIYAPQLSHENDGKKFNETDEHGLPIFDENGSRTLYAEEGGLRRLYCSRDLDLSARCKDMTDSYEYGRVIICAEGPFAEKLTKW